MTWYRDGEAYAEEPTELNPLGFTARQIACVGLPCPYCGNEMEYTKGKRMPTRDHFFPKSKYRHFYRDENGLATVMVCNKCNNSKGDSHFMDWAARYTDKKRHGSIMALRRGFEDGTITIPNVNEMNKIISEGGDPRGFLGIPFEISHK